MNQSGGISHEVSAYLYLHHYTVNGENLRLELENRFQHKGKYEQGKWTCCACLDKISVCTKISLYIGKEVLKHVWPAIKTVV